MANTNKSSYKVFFYPSEKDGLIHYFSQADKEELPLIIRWLLDQGDRFFMEEEPDKIFYPIWIIIHSAKDLLRGQSSGRDKDDTFSQELLRDDDADSERKIPILHLSMSDLFIDTLFGTAALPMDVPRSYMIMDNSIWNYLVPISETYYVHNLTKYNRTINELNGNKEYFLRVTQDCKTNFFEAINSICKNYKKNLYRLKVAQEYADLNARLTEQAYLSGAHASGVSPFIFHSEIAAKQLIQREFRLKEKTTAFLYDIKSKYEPVSILDRMCRCKWRILLLDDKAIDPMETNPFYSSKDKERGGWNCKLEIIKNIIERQLGLWGELAFCPCYKKKQNDNIQTIEIEPNETTRILIEYAQSLDEAEIALREKKYDFVLIDYLLNQIDGTHYGYELLDDIWNDQQWHKSDEEKMQYKVYPHRSQRLYCMFISAYSYAVHDRLLAEGLNQSEDYWYISVGACPTNTPQLFLYNLLKIMEKRLDDSGILKLSTTEILSLICKIFIPKEKDPKRESVRKRANDYYQEVLSLQYHYRSILKDVEIPLRENSAIFDTNGSVLMTDFIQKKINLGGMLEHLTQLIHLTAFGTVRQWPEMWEEYIYFKAQFEKQLEFDKESSLDCNILFSYIERYILDLKSQQK